MRSGAEEQRSTAVRILQHDAAGEGRKHSEVGGSPRKDHTPGKIEGEESLASHSSCWTMENANLSPGLKRHRPREHLVFPMGEVEGGGERIEDEEDRHEDEEGMKGQRHAGEDSEEGNTLEAGAVVTAAWELGVVGSTGQEWTMMGSPFARLLSDSRSS